MGVLVDRFEEHDGQLSPSLCSLLGSTTGPVARWGLWTDGDGKVGWEQWRVAHSWDNAL